MDGKIYLQAESGMLEKTGFKGRQIGLKPVFLTAGKERTFTFVLVEKNGTVTDGQKKSAPSLPRKAKSPSATKN